MSAPQPDYAAGGLVGGTSAPLPVLDSGFVITRAQLEALGSDMLDRLNLRDDEDGEP